MSPRTSTLDPAVEHRPAFEELLADLSAKFVNIPPGEVDSAIEDAQRRVCEYLGLDLSALWQWLPEAPYSLRLSHLYRPLGGPPVPEPMDAHEYFPWSQAQVLAGRTVALSSLAELPEEAARDREVYQQFGIKTALTIPLSSGGNSPFGTVSFNTMIRERSWPAGIVRRLQLVAQVFANALARRRSDEALSESEERLQLAAESAGIGLWSLTLATRTFWLSDRARELFGFSPDEVVTFARLLEVVHPEDWDTVRDKLEELSRSTGEHAEVEYRIVLADRRVRWIRSRGSFRRGPGGAPERLMGVSADVTARRKAESAVRELADRYENLSNTTMDAFWEMDEQGRILWVNDECCRRYGYSRDELLAASVMDLEAREDPAATRAHIQAVKASGSDRFESRHRCKDGRLVDVEISAVYLRSSGTFTVFVHDITNRKRAQEALRASEATARATFEQAALGMAHFRPDGRLLRVNDKLCSILGYRSDELTRMTIQEVTHPDDREQNQDQRNLLLRGVIPTFSAQTRYVRRDGSLVWVNRTISLVRDAAGEPDHFISIIEDITERKREQAAMADLRRRVIRTHEDERARLARDLHDDVTQRLALLAIEVGQLLDRRHLDRASGGALRTVRDGLVRLSEDVHSLAYQLHPSVLDDLGLGEALRAECERFSLQASVAVDFRLAELPDEIATDVALGLFRVTQEALRNIARHAAARSAEISLRQHDGGLQLAIRDDGAGFDPTLPRVRRSLGLASMRERVELLGGELDIESAPGQGTTLHAWLPLTSRH